MDEGHEGVGVVKEGGELEDFQAEEDEMDSGDEEGGEEDTVLALAVFGNGDRMFLHVYKVISIIIINNVKYRVYF